MMDMRVCKRCGHDAPLNSFVKIDSGDGWSDVCTDPSECNYLREQQVQSPIHPADPGAKLGEPGYVGRPRKA
jgi:hypothetical protein